MEFNNHDAYVFNQFIKNTRKKSATKKILKNECENLIKHFLDKQEREEKEGLEEEDT